MGYPNCAHGVRAIDCELCIHDKATGAAFAEGFAAGLEAAAKVCEERVSLEPNELAAAIRASKNTGRTPRPDNKET